MHVLQMDTYGWTGRNNELVSRGTAWTRFRNQAVRTVVKCHLHWRRLGFFENECSVRKAPSRAPLLVCWESSVGGHISAGLEARGKPGLTLLVLHFLHICFFAQEQAELSLWDIVASATGSSPHGASEASLTECLGRPQRDCPQGSVSSLGTSSVCWVLLCTRTQLCLSLSARTATPNSISATVFSGPSYRESMSPQLASGNLVQSRPLLDFLGPLGGCHPVFWVLTWGGQKLG